jgi:ribosomal protein S18 acetylase RimI-like enzyme
MGSIIYSVNESSEYEVLEHLSLCEMDFVPPLSERVDLGEYAKKLIDKSIRYEAKTDSHLVGLVAAYINEVEGFSYITNVSLLRDYRNRGIGRRLMKAAALDAENKGLNTLVLETARENEKALSLYLQLGFIIDADESDQITLKKVIASKV